MRQFRFDYSLNLYLRCNTDTNVVNGLKNSSSYETIDEKSLEIDEVYTEKSKLTNFAHELLMSFLNIYMCASYVLCKVSCLPAKHIASPITTDTPAIISS